MLKIYIFNSYIFQLVKLFRPYIVIASSLHNAQQEEKTADISLLKEKDREILPGQRIEEVLTGKKRLEEILPGKRRIKEILSGKRTQIRCRTKEEKQSQIQHAMEKG